MRAFCSPPRWSERDHRYFIRSPRESPVWHPAAATDSPSRYFRWAEMPAARSGPLLAAWIIIPHGRASLAWFALAAMLAIAVLWNVSAWYKRQHLDRPLRREPAWRSRAPVSPRRVAWSVCILLMLIFSKYFYLASITSYYSFYLIEKFHLSVQSAQLYLFYFLLAAALGTLDRRADRRPRGPQARHLVFHPWASRPSRCCCPMSTCCGPGS